MVGNLQLIRNVGTFDSVQGSPQTHLARLSLIYAENGCGKTTTCAILRSLRSGDEVFIRERTRLGAQHAAHVVVECASAAQLAVFQNGTWTRTLPDLVIFDDVFVDQNVYSGMVVSPEHRQNLHEVIVGDRGVTLARQLDSLASRIGEHNAALRLNANAIPEGVRGNLSVDDFCALTNHPDIDNAIQVAERRLAALNSTDAVRTTPAFEVLALPPIDSAVIEALLARSLPNLDAQAIAVMKQHFAHLGDGGEQWVGDGTQRLQNAAQTDRRDSCPYCAQDLRDSTMVDLYRAFFGDAYSALKREIITMLTFYSRSLAGDELATFVQAIQTAETRRRFWSSFCNVPEIVIDVPSLTRMWQVARDVVLEAITAKQFAPHDARAFNEDARGKISAYQELAIEIAAISASLQTANESITQLKADTAVGNAATAANEVARLKATKARCSPAIEPLCTSYVQEKAAKATTEAEKVRVRSQLDAHRAAVFPTYQRSINDYLHRFNAGFSIEGVTPSNPSGRPSSTYHIVINNTRVNLGGDSTAAGTQCFKNTLSGGDRNALALAFFFAALDQDANLANRIIVIDDPCSSLDDHRELTTVQEIRRLVQRVSQVIILSHNKAFLCRIWDHADHRNAAAIEMRAGAVGSIITQWDVNADCITEYDRRHAALRDYRDRRLGNPRDIAEGIRPVLERFLRVACPEHFPPGRLLGPFRGLARQRLAANQPIISANDLQELDDLTEYANRFHHDTNQAWETEVVNETQLHGFVQRTLNFVRR